MLCINFATAASCAWPMPRHRFAKLLRGPASMRNSLLITAALVTVGASSAEARAPVATGTPTSMQRLLACRSIQDGAQRLACFDRETASVDQAISKKDL